MTRVGRWGRSAYETDADLAMEEAAARAIGATWVHEPGPTPPAWLAAADVLIVTSGVRVDASVVDALPDGAWVITTTSGYDHIDLPACHRRGVVVGRCPLARRDPVVEHALLSLLWLLRRMPALDRAARAGRWARAALPALAPRGLDGARVVVVGVGVIGSVMADRLDALGAEVIEVDPFSPPGRRPRLPLPDALDGADAVTLHCALSARSHRLIGPAEIALLPSGAVVVNTARGDVLDVDAAVDAVLAGRLGGLACDVFPAEPWPRLAVAAEHPALLLTPHAAGYTRGLGGRVAAEVAAALRARAAGMLLPPHPVHGG